MEIERHNINELFRQLGLPDNDDAVERFISEHELPRSQSVPDADFWNRTQAEFLRSALEEDADWAEIVDELDARLHKHRGGCRLSTSWLRTDSEQILPPLG